MYTSGAFPLPRGGPGRHNTPMRVLGIESSCDDTGVAIYDSEAGLLGHKLYSQTVLHKEYGGVVPELASRDHIRKLLPLIRAVMDECQCSAGQILRIQFFGLP